MSNIYDYSSCEIEFGPGDDEEDGDDTGLDEDDDEEYEEESEDCSHEDYGHRPDRRVGNSSKRGSKYYTCNLTKVMVL